MFLCVFYCKKETKFDKKGCTFLSWYDILSATVPPRKKR